MSTWAAACKDWDEWTRPGPPFRVFGDTYYVGTCGISAVLVATEEGDILIDGTPAGSADVVANNISALGFRLSDVKIILITHEHFDHVGAVAELQRRTGARLLASPAAAEVLRSGKVSLDDPQYGTIEGSPTARVDGVLTDGAPVRLGDVALYPVFTPGHTAGATSWYWTSCQSPGNCRTIDYIDSLSPVSGDSYRFSDHPAYIAAYRASLATVAALPCGILLAPHPSSAHLRERIAAGDLADPDSCRKYAEDLRARLDERLAKERQ